jgi:hypothetical protein
MFKRRISRLMDVTPHVALLVLHVLHICHWRLMLRRTRAVRAQAPNEAAGLHQVNRCLMLASDYLPELIHHALPSDTDALVGNVSV